MFENTSEAINQMTDNTMGKGKRTKGQTLIYKTLHWKLKMTTNDISIQITITIYLLHYLIKLRGLY